MTEGVVPDYQKDEWEKNLEMVRKMTGGGPGADGPPDREAIALERIADTLDNIAALLASQRVPAGSPVYASAIESVLVGALPKLVNIAATKA